jgi:hypothetical protein
MIKLLTALFVLIIIACNESSSSQPQNAKQMSDALWQDTCKCDTADIRIEIDQFNGTKTAYKLASLTSDFAASSKAPYFFPVLCRMYKNYTDSSLLIFFEVHSDLNREDLKCYTIGDEATFILTNDTKITVPNKLTNCDNKFVYSCGFDNFIDLQKLTALRMHNIKAVRFYDSKTSFDLPVDSTSAKHFRENLCCLYKR